MKTALLAIDYINGIMGGYDEPKRQAIVSNANKVIAVCREQGMPIYFVRLAFDAQYSGKPKHSNMFNYLQQNERFQLQKPDTEFVSALDVLATDVVINKTGASPFCGNNLQQQLQANNIERLIFAGVATDNAIDIGVRQAHDDGYYTVVIEDACAASTDEFHQWPITMLKKIANTIVTADEFINKE